MCNLHNTTQPDRADQNGVSRRTQRKLDRLAKETKQGNNQHRKISDATQLGRADSNGISDRTQRKLDRLAKERPDLLERVKAGELKINRAAIEAGIVKSPTKLDKAQPPESPVSAG